MGRTRTQPQPRPEGDATQGDLPSELAAPAPPKVTVTDCDLSPEAQAVVTVLTGHLRAGRKPAELAGRILLALADVPGPIEQQVRRDVGALGRLDGARAIYAQVAYRLARALDADDDEGATGLSGAARELRAALDAVWRGVKVERESDRRAANLGRPV